LVLNDIFLLLNSGTYAVARTLRVDSANTSTHRVA
jgi:hypothetical protein